ncbi:MAG: FkbM family methyltransferase [Deltaproteobacteria bacterium]
MAVRDRFLDLRERVEVENPVIVDGGANKGDMTERFLHLYKNPIIHAFEPIPELALELRKRFASSKNVVVHENALGAEGKGIRFNVLKNIVSSSVLKPTDIKRSYHGSKVDVERSIEVRQVRLDEAIKAPVDIMKLDLQGYELEALKGAEGLLNDIKAITTEVEFTPLYEGQPLFSDIDKYLREKGFRLLNLYELFTHPDGQLTAGDAVYLNKRFFNL